MKKISLKTFRGGVHPDDGKGLSAGCPLRPIEPGAVLYYPLGQHAGAPAVPIVQPGEQVLRGQKIAEAGGFVSAPVHSGVSGTVRKIQKMRMPGGGTSDCIVIENDGKMREVPFIPADFTRLSAEEIVKRVAEAGVIGQGGAGFPTHVKLSPGDPSRIDTVLLNGAECEPYLTSDYRRMLENPELVVEGLKILLQIFPGAEGIICVEDNKRDCAEALQKACRNASNIRVQLLKTKYPQGAERMLIWAATGRKINSSLLPADAGCIVDNVETAVSVYRAVALGEPLTECTMTVTGDAAAKPQNLVVPTGMLYREVLEAAGGLSAEPEKMIAGGPMMGNALFDLDTVVTKTSSALLLFRKDPVAEQAVTACINCGRCAEVCPGRILPARLAVFADHGAEEQFLKYHGMECCECGCCSFVCPAKRQLSQSIKSMRRLLLARRKKG